jgi:acetylornithine deacetylase/succinyl-diaminopimelate desuccinylase-like protein
MKSQAVFGDGTGIPGASGEPKGTGVPMRAGQAKLPGDVPSARLEGFEPTGGNSHARASLRADPVDIAGPWRRSYHPRGGGQRQGVQGSEPPVFGEWEWLLARLADVPRENGTAELHRTAEFLREALEATGAAVEVAPFTAGPWVLRLAGILILAGALLYFRWLRAGRCAPALAVALGVPAFLLAQLELMLPVLAWIGAEQQVQLVGRVAPRRPPEQRLVFAAHYDSKTDLLDHVERAPVDFLAAPMIPLMAAGALAGLAAKRGKRGARPLAALASLAAWSAAAYGALAFAALTAGAFVPARSRGALDDGGSCAVLVRMARELARAPRLERTEVELLLLSAEEVGVQGSWAHARERYGAGADLPTFVVNLEGIGASAEHAVIPRERFPLRSFAPDPRIVALLDAVHAERFGVRLLAGPAGGATDARSFLAHGIPAATLFSLEPGRALPRALHSARDDRSRLDPAALDATLAYLLSVAAAADALGFGA